MTISDTDRRAPLASAVNRRTVLVAFGALGLAGAAVRPALGQQAGSTPVPAAGEATPSAGAEVNLEVQMPDWRFAVVTVQDPYPGTLNRPDSVPAGLRVVAYQVVLTNDSNMPMEFTISDIRLRDSDGVEYRAGEYIGTEPRLVSQNLPDGERTRGWVWFGIPENSQPSSIVFIAPPPTLRIRLD